MFHFPKGKKKWGKSKHRPRVDFLHRIRMIRQSTPKRSQLMAQRGRNEEEQVEKKLVTTVECIITNESALLCPKGSDVVFVELAGTRGAG